MKFYILDTGYLKTDKNNVVANSTMATRKNPEVMHTFYNLPVMCILIEHNGEYILYDTGSHLHSMRDHWPESLQDAYELHREIPQALEIQLALCGVRAEQVKTVILSHMHFDHTGNIHLFPDADIYAPKADYLYAKNVVNTVDDDSRHEGYCKKDINLEIKKLHLVEEEFEIIPGVRVINLPGHTPGLLGLIIDLPKSGTYIFPMDAVYTNEIYGPPAKASGLLFNRTEYFASIEKVRELQKKYNATMIPAHDWELFKTLKKAPLFYE